MVHKAFREILGETATQAGSENSPGRFRFDFPSASAVSPTVLQDVEARVNALLLDDLEVSAEEMSQAQAREIGAMALFGEKYGDRVRVVSVGEWARSGQLGVVKILSESSIGAGVRRVEALVGVDAYRFLAREHILLNSLTELIKGARSEELPERISDLMARMKEMEKEIAAVRTAQARAQAKELATRFEEMNGFKVLTAQVGKNVSADDLRTMALELKEEGSPAVVILASENEGRVVLVAASNEKARARGAKAGQLVKAMSTVLGGGGGGKDDFAQGGGVKISEISKAFEESKRAIAALS
jgi:alanyl-tRNA synthetase